MQNSNSCLINFFKKIQKQLAEVQKQSPEMLKKCVLKNLVNFTGKHLFPGKDFFNKFAGLQPARFLNRLQHQCFSVKSGKLLRTPILTNKCERLLLKICLWNWEKLKFIHKKVFEKKRNRFFEHQYQKQVHDSYFMIGFPWRFLWFGEKQTPIPKYLELIQRRSNIQ